MKKILIFAAILLCIFCLAFYVKGIVAKQAYERGMCCAEQGDYHGAIKDFSTMYSLTPDDVDALTNRAAAYEPLGMSKEALNDYNDAVKLAMRMSGRFARSAAGQDSISIAALSSVSTRPTNGRCLDYENALKIAPDMADAANNLACLLATCPDQSLRNGVQAVKLACEECKRSKGQNANYL